MVICQLLAAKRESKSLTQDQVAKLVDISRAHYTNIENGIRNPSTQLAKKIATTLDFDWTLFFEDNENAS